MDADMQQQGRFQLKVHCQELGICLIIYAHEGSTVEEVRAQLLSSVQDFLEKLSAPTTNSVSVISTGPRARLLDDPYISSCFSTGVSPILKVREIAGLSP
mmetsp:Transcript_32848/g.82491  ORF Transcript_32848/g.82491 Transcript_32848/m.82491 type:complete len:100 (+) Transcript_32848:131-430(+)|eukprot:CAMPEP_0177633324 /NCGR_PEP_ID=MMETSP0447-20121125/2778_1 /TAXON_ID=0 /ORGANISM="Stygamoeba regulata, Strain BSH-02190019" /LENGTH=99 /DNA_ID=CAMNT_0019134979 /DNA_START=105 /DNA_END=404 /DNA_ORIENTATION=+